MQLQSSGLFPGFLHWKTDNDLLIADGRTRASYNVQLPLHSAATRGAQGIRSLAEPRGSCCNPGNVKIERVFDIEEFGEEPRP